MTSWNITALADLIEQRYSDQQRRLFEESFNSLAERQIYASYHFYEHKRIVEEFILAKGKDEHILETLLNLSFSALSIENPLTQVAAHVTACLQSLHSLLDTMAHVVCYAYGLNVGKDGIKEGVISVKSVCKRLEQIPQYCTVFGLLKGLTTGEDVEYLGALVNYSKHRSVIKPRPEVGNQYSSVTPFTLCFEEFEYNNQQYGKTLLKSF